ncbi:MAG: hypothetical protein E7161_05395 [Firmicutes bacterium]|nr:hypothetical protein [Bacillota bacterium]
MEKINYFLVLEKRLGDNILIDINKLDICSGVVINNIASIDAFTCRFSEIELKASIERSNMAQVDYLNGTLKVISDVKHNLRVLTKDIFTSIVEFQKNDELLDQDYKNKLFGIYKKMIESTFEDKGFIQGMLDRFKLALKSSNKDEIFSIIEELPYAKSRSIYFTIFDVNMRRNAEMLRKLEKLDDVA